MTPPRTTIKTKGIFVLLLLICMLFVFFNADRATLDGPVRKLSDKETSLLLSDNSALPNKIQRTSEPSQPSNGWLSSHAVPKLPYVIEAKQTSSKIGEILVANKDFDLGDLIATITAYAEEGKLYQLKILVDFYFLLGDLSNNLEAVIILAHAFYENGDGDYANEIFERGILMNPQDMGFRYSYGDLKEIGGDIDGALEQYFMIIEEDPSEAQAYFRVGEVYLKLGNSTEADNYFAQAELLSPDFSGLIRELKTAWAEGQLPTENLGRDQ